MVEVLAFIAACQFADILSDHDCFPRDEDMALQKEVSGFGGWAYNLECGKLLVSFSVFDFLHPSHVKDGAGGEMIFFFYDLEVANQ